MSDVLQLIHETFGGQMYDGYVAINCFWHSDSRPSLFVREDYYKCVACGASGKTEQLASMADGLPVRPEVQPFRNPFTDWLKQESLRDVLKSAFRSLQERPSEYLRTQRGITAEFATKARVGLRDGWYTFPIWDSEHSLVGAVARAGFDCPSKYVVPNGQDPNLLYVPDWGLLAKGRYVLVTYGIIDAVTLAMLGYPAMSTTAGKRLDVSVLDAFQQRIYFLPDDGEEKEAMKMADKIGWRGKVFVYTWSDGCKDINDVWVKHPYELETALKKRFNREQ